MHNIELIVFDLAGTTIEDSGQVVDAFTWSLNAYGFHLTKEKLNSVRGASKREVIRSFVIQESSGKESDIEHRTHQIYNSFRDRLSGIYRENGVREIRGTLQTFEWLRDRGIRIALNTGFDRWLTELILQTVGWNRDLIQAVVCSDDVAQGRPFPDLILCAMKSVGVIDKNRVANVGDTELDLQAGANAGVYWNIGVLSGAHKEEQLRQAPHTHLIRSVADLPSLW